MIERFNSIIASLLNNEYFVIAILMVNLGVFAVGYYLDSIDTMLISTSSFALILFSAAYHDTLNDGRK